MRKAVCFALVAVLPFLSACDRLADVLELPDTSKEVAESEAIGSACRQSGRSIEDCYALYPEAQKASVFSGWKSMNAYMMELDLKEVPSVVPRSEIPAPQVSDKSAEPEQQVAVQDIP